MTGDENRRRSILKALRKMKIDHAVSYKNYYYYDNLHQYSKNKIHCSCPMCSAKTRNKGGSKHKGMSPFYQLQNLRYQKTPKIRIFQRRFGPLAQ